MGALGGECLVGNSILMIPSSQQQHHTNTVFPLYTIMGIVSADIVYTKRRSSEGSKVVMIVAGAVLVRARPTDYVPAQPRLICPAPSGERRCHRGCSHPRHPPALASHALRPPRHSMTVWREGQGDKTSRYRNVSSNSKSE